MYNLIQPSRQTNCTTCGTTLKYTNYRTYSTPSKIEEYLRQHTDFEGHTHENDKVCFTCYKSHLIILQTSNCTSRDADLEQIIYNISKQIPISPVGSVKEAIDRAINAVTIEVGKLLLENNVILLPAIQDLVHSYMKKYSAEVEHHGIIKQVITSRWILSHSTVSLQHHITYACKTRKYGTLVYRPNTDFISAITRLLWQQRKTQITSECDESCTSQSNISSDHSKELMDELNDRVHYQSQVLRAKDDKSPFEYANLDLDKFIRETDPMLWEAVCSLTRSKAERRNSSRVSDPASQAHHIKRVRNFYLLCIIIFCADDRCSLPLHTPITDVIDSQGGSALLVKILNRIGVCASLDSLSRFVQFKSLAQNVSDHDYLSPESFTLVSADNIHFLHSFARVFKGNKNSSWQGTSVQVVQPLPGLSNTIECTTMSWKTRDV